MRVMTWNLWRNENINCDIMSQLIFFVLSELVRAWAGNSLVRRGAAFHGRAGIGPVMSVLVCVCGRGIAG